MKTTPKLRLYGLVPYDRSAKARWILTELGVPFEDVWLDREKREHEAPEYLRINPMGRVPALTIDERPMWESGAICAHLADLFPGLAPKLDSPERGEYQQWLHFASATIDPIQRKIMIVEDIPAGEVQKKKEAELQTELRDALEAMDVALGKGAFLVGGRFSAADICVSYHLYWLRLWPELDSVVQDFPKTVAYLARMQAMPSAAKADVFSYEG